MNRRVQTKLERIVDEPWVREIDAPATGHVFLEVPLDYWVTPNGEIEPEGHPEACRLVLRVVYQSFTFPSQVGATMVVEAVTAKLRELGGGYIWWGKRPNEDATGAWRLRLGTSPALPDAWWVACFQSIESALRG